MTNEEAIEVIKQDIPCEHDTDLIEALDVAIKAIQQTTWIPCSERLPESAGVYIVTEKVFRLDDREHKGKYKTMVEPVEYCNDKWQRANFFDVIAWMPLPEPYKGE